MIAGKIDILNWVASGKLSVDEGNRLLVGLETGKLVNPIVWMPGYSQPVGTGEEEGMETQPILSAEEMKWVKTWQRWNWMPLSLALVLTGFAALWVHQAYLMTGLSLRFWASWIPFLIGVLGVFVFWGMQSSRARLYEKQNTISDEINDRQESLQMIKAALKTEELTHMHVIR
jgi:hypothetical protein